MQDTPKNNIKPTLLILAAGMGSRYGGLKQLDGVGPSGETIMDYSVYDAIRAGFGKIVFVIRHDFEDEFRSRVLAKYADKVNVDVTFQTADALPRGYAPENERTRPWGTNHAVLMAADVIREPFAVINADDFYGAHAFHVIADFLSKSAFPGRYCMVGFKVGNTMTPNGSVSRGVCTVDARGRLRRIVERRKIAYLPNGDIAYRDETDNTHHLLDANVPVSMNLWGFTPDYFDFSRREFARFLDRYINDNNREFFIPSVVDKLIGNNEATVQVLNTDAKWFGVTYADDRQGVCDGLRQQHDNGTYPTPLFG